MSTELHLLEGEHAVYPGHPVTIAYCIVRAFPSLAAAQARGREFPAALESNAIPGAGGCVYAALDFLRYAINPAVGWDRAFKYAERCWRANCSDAFQDRFEPGKEQAERIAPKLRTQLETWR